jgi:EAL domain-containing protein (putative c-di-GMP-specific phosphodiesterase class I)
MEAIRAAGAELAIDDFGVGFSSISYLHDLPVQYLKADASLAQDIDTDERARALLRSVIAMGRTLGLSLVVEGIESEAQLVALGDDTADLSAQGYLMYRPMPAVRLVDVVAADAHALQATGIGGGAATGRVSRVDRWQEVAAAAGMPA